MFFSLSVKVAYPGPSNPRKLNPLQYSAAKPLAQWRRDSTTAAAPTGTRIQAAMPLLPDHAELAAAEEAQRDAARLGGAVGAWAHPLARPSP